MDDSPLVQCQVEHEASISVALSLALATGAVAFREKTGRTVLKV
jgi:hypothetical protein